MNLSNQCKGDIKMLKKQSGFTLIEMLIVMSIITVLLLLIVPNVLGKGEKINETGCQALVAVVQAQVNAYELDKGFFPESLEQLETVGFINEDQLSCKEQNLNYSKNDGIVSLPNNE